MENPPAALISSGHHRTHRKEGEGADVKAMNQEGGNQQRLVSSPPAHPPYHPSSPTEKQGCQARLQGLRSPPAGPEKSSRAVVFSAGSGTLGEGWLWAASPVVSTQWSGMGLGAWAVGKYGEAAEASGSSSHCLSYTFPSAFLLYIY